MPSLQVMPVYSEIQKECINKVCRQNGFANIKADVASSKHRAWKFETIQTEQINEKKKVSERNNDAPHVRGHSISLHQNQRVAVTQNSLFIHDTRGNIMNGTQIGPQMCSLISYPFYYV